MSALNKLTIRTIVSSFLVYILGGFFSLFIGLMMSILLFPIRSFISPDVVEKFTKAWAYVNLYILKFFCSLDYRVHGEENLANLTARKRAQGFIVMSNHQSAWDILMCLRLFRRSTFVAKESLLRIPMFGWGMRLLKPVTINRKDGKNAMRSVLEQGSERLKENYTFIIYPEGTRQPKDIVGEYKKGAVILATNSKAMVLPVVHNAGQFWSRKSLWRFPGTIDVVIGEAIDPEEYTLRELSPLIENWSRAQLSLIKKGKPQPNLKLDLSNLELI